MSSRFFSFLGTQLADITSTLVAFPAIRLSEDLVTSIIGINNPHHHYIPSPSSTPSPLTTITIFIPNTMVTIITTITTYPRRTPQIWR